LHFSAMLAGSHRFCSIRSVVRGGAGATTSVPSRLYTLATP
jgi:hypothetical protein